MHFDPQITPWSIDEQQFPLTGSLREKIAFLIGYAVLAPSSHNTQPWLFQLHDDAVDLRIDHSRWLKIADKDQRELHISVGCALENLLVAAEHFGLGHAAVRLPDQADPLLAATIRFSETGSAVPHREQVLFDMLPVRHTNHRHYDGRPIPAQLRERLVACCVEPEIVVYLTDDVSIKESVDEWIVKADAVQFARPEYRAELSYWIGQGVFGSTWLMSKLGQFAVSHLNLAQSIARQDSELLMSSPLFGLIASADSDRRQQIIAGQVYQRMSLIAASGGIWFHPLSQLVQVPEIKQELLMAAPSGGLIPQIPFRVGFAEAEPEHTPRRPLSDVLI
jgi:hypothetical protein